MIFSTRSRFGKLMACRSHLVCFICSLCMRQFDLIAEDGYMNEPTIIEMGTCEGLLKSKIQIMLGFGLCKPKRSYDY